MAKIKTVETDSGPLEEPIMNTVQTVGGGSGTPNPYKQRAVRDVEALPSAGEPIPPMADSDIPEAPHVYHPNVAAAGEPISFSPPSTTTTKSILYDKVDQTGPPVNPAPNHPQRTYTENEVADLLAKQARTSKEVLTAPLTEARLVTEQWVAVKPNRTIEPFIGTQKWYLQKDKTVKVPQSVAQVLAQAGVIYPVFQF